jgi:hypothetical protein
MPLSSRNPFDLLIDPESVIRAVQTSRDLVQLQSRVNDADRIRFPIQAEVAAFDQSVDLEELNRPLPKKPRSPASCRE